MFLAPRQRKTTVFTRFWASASKNHGIYRVLWPGPSKNTGIYAASCMLSEAFFGCQRHKNIVNYTIFTRGQYQKIMKNWPKTDQKTPNKDLQNASANFTLFFPTPNPQKRENPSRLKDFRGGSAAGARPRVAKAMLSCHHYTARHRRIFELTLIVGSAGPLGPPFHRSVGVKVTEWGPASEIIYSLGFLEHICWNRQFWGEQVSSRKLLRRVFPKELLPISTCYFV